MPHMKVVPPLDPRGSVKAKEVPLEEEIPPVSLTPDPATDALVEELVSIKRQLFSLGKDVGAVDTKVVALASKVDAIAVEVSKHKQEDAKQDAKIEGLSESVLAVRAKQVGLGSIAWAIGVGAFYLIQMLLGGQIPVPGQPPSIKYLPVPGASVDVHP